MIPPDNEFREKIRKDRISFIMRSTEWVLSVPNEVWSKKQSEFINSQFHNRKSYPLTKSQYLHMIETARRLSGRRKGSPPMPERFRKKVSEENYL